MIIPIGRCILVEQHRKDMAATGIILPSEVEDSVKKPSGRVELVGLGVDTSVYDLHEDDVVFFNEFSGERVMEGEREWLLLRPEEVLARMFVGESKRDVC